MSSPFLTRCYFSGVTGPLSVAKSSLFYESKVDALNFSYYLWVAVAQKAQTQLFNMLLLQDLFSSLQPKLLSPVWFTVVHGVDWGFHSKATLLLMCDTPGQDCLFSWCQTADKALGSQASARSSLLTDYNSSVHSLWISTLSRGSLFFYPHLKIFFLVF